VKTPLYLKIGWFTTASILCFALSDFLSGFQGVTSVQPACSGLLSTTTTLYQGGLTSLHVVLLLRLQQLYGESQFRYGRGCMTCGFTIITICFLITVSLTRLTIHTLDLFDDGAPFPNWCYSHPSSIAGLVIGMNVLLQDVFLSTAFVLAFFIPFRKTLKLLAASSRGTKDSSIYEKIIHTGRKTLILTAVTVFSTILSMVLLLVIPLFTWIFSVDIMINIWCLMLMTPYYPDRVYYNRVCCCCVCCCDKRRGSTTDEEMIGLEVEVEPSAKSQTMASASSTAFSSTASSATMSSGLSTTVGSSTLDSSTAISTTAASTTAGTVSTTVDTQSALAYAATRLDKDPV
jgi:hypothetical protein